MSDLSNLINRLRENAEGEGIAIFAEAADALAAVQQMQAQVAALAGALQLAMPLIEQQYFLESGSYGKNHSASRSEIARSRYEKARAALGLANAVDARARIEELEKPIDMILHCPACLEQHIDRDEAPTIPDEGGLNWHNQPHRSHLCLHCGFVWRPADVATNGVAEIKTKGKNDMVLFDGPREVTRQIRMRDAAQPKLDWEGDRP